VGVCLRIEKLIANGASHSRTGYQYDIIGQLIQERNDNNLLIETMTHRDAFKIIKKYQQMMPMMDAY